MDVLPTAKAVNGASLLCLPPELLSGVCRRLSPADSLLFRSTNSVIRGLSTPHDRVWDLVRGPAQACLHKGLQLMEMNCARLSDVRPPRVARREWPEVRTTGRSTAIDEPTLKRYALNASLLRFLARAGHPARDAYGDAWDEGRLQGPPPEDKKRWAYIQLPPAPSGIHANQICTLTYEFELTKGAYARAHFSQHKGANAAGIDTCFEHARLLYEQALHQESGQAGLTFLFKPFLHGGERPLMSQARASEYRSRFGA
jgi:hypothetical protein